MATEETAGADAPVEVLILEEATEVAPDVAPPSLAPDSSQPPIGSEIDPPVAADLSTALNERLSALEQGQLALATELESLRQTFDSKIKYESGKDKIIDSLHAELQNYKDDLVFKILRPVIVDLIDMHNDITNMIRYDAVADAPSEAGRQPANALTSFQSTIEEILARNGVEAFTVPDEIYNPKRQRSTRVIDTPDQTQDGRVATRQRKGFMYGERVIAYEQVGIYRYQPGSNTEELTGGL